MFSEQRKRPQSLESIARFVDTTESIVDFECLTDSNVVFSTHDDCVCHFEFLDRKECDGVLRSSVEFDLEVMLWNALLAHCGRCVTIRDNRKVTAYETFYDYLGARN